MSQEREKEKQQQHNTKEKQGSLNFSGRNPAGTRHRI